MTRHKAALLGCGLAVVLAGIYLLLRRRRAASAVPQATPVGRPDPLPVAPSSEVASAEPAAVATTKSAPRSWGGRAVPARTPPPPPAEATASADDAEVPLPTWVRVGIVAAALIAFFAVSLIATKQV